MEDDKFGGDLYDQYGASILDTKYEKVDLDGLAKEQSHLPEIQQEDLHILFKNNEELFSGKLGYYPHRKFHVEIAQGAQPVHARAYPFHIYIMKHSRKNSTISLRLVSWTFKDPVNGIVLILFKQISMAVFSGSAIYDL